MNHKIKFFMACLAALPLVSCTENDEVPDAHPQALQVGVRAGCSPQVSNRAVILGESLPDRSRIGVFLDADDTPGNYDGQVYHNCCYEAVGEDEAQVWKKSDDPSNPNDKEILLSPSIGTAYAYYPYDPAVTDITRIPVSVDNDTPENQRDYMYSEPYSAVYVRNNKAYFLMKHALTSIQLYVLRGNYTGTGKVTDVSITCGGLAKSGILNAKNGTISEVGPIEDITGTYSESFTATTLLKAFEPLIAVPTGKPGNVTVSMNVDGRPYSFTTTTTFARSTRYVYRIGIDEEKLSIEGITVTPWVDDPNDNVGEENITLPASIRILGDVTDIAFHRSDADGRITLRCVPRIHGRMVLEPTVKFFTSGSESCVSQSVDGVTGIRTIVIDNPKTAISFTFHGLEEAEESVP